MRIRATVRRVTGTTTHLRGAATARGIEVTKIPDPAVVEIVEEEGAIYLLRLDPDDQCIADTWHDSMEAAKAQAHFEFGIQDSDWKEVGPRH